MFFPTLFLWFRLGLTRAFTVVFFGMLPYTYSTSPVIHKMGPESVRVLCPDALSHSSFSGLGKGLQG